MTLSGNSLRQTVHTHRASVHQAAKLVAVLLRVVGVIAGLAESNGSIPPGLWLMSPAGWLPRTGISSGTLRSVIEYGLPLPFFSGWAYVSWFPLGSSSTCAGRETCGTGGMCLYWPNVLFVTQPSVSSHRRKLIKSVLSLVPRLSTRFCLQPQLEHLQLSVDTCCPRPRCSSAANGRFKLTGFVLVWVELNAAPDTV